jgi:hypothetical protein
MSASTVTLLVAVLAPSATIIAAFIGVRKDRKSRRDVLLKDLEILEKLPNQGLTYYALSAYVDRRTMLLAVEDHMSVYFYSVAVLISVIVLAVLAGIVGNLTGHMRLGLVVAGVLLPILATILIGCRYAKMWFATKFPGRIQRSVTTYLQKSFGARLRIELTETMREIITPKVRAPVVKDIQEVVPEGQQQEAIALMESQISRVVDEQINKLVEGELGQKVESVLNKVIDRVISGSQAQPAGTTPEIDRLLPGLRDRLSGTTPVEDN